MMKVLRTPDERFSALEDFAFAPHYAEVSDLEGSTLRVHYLDEGPADGEVVLLMHGEPSWSYLYRKVIPILVADGYRCVAPDLVGFGRSDKPAEPRDYSYARHVAWMDELIFGHLGLEDVTLFCQDWGGLIGLRLVAAHPEKFGRVIISNTGLPTGDEPMSEAFMAWQQYSQTVEDLHVGGIVKGGCVTKIGPAVVEGYDAPFPDDSYKAGARVFPSLVPTRPDDPEHDANVAAWAVLEGFRKPFVCAFSDSDPITGGGDRLFKRRVPGCVGVEHFSIAGGGHFVQEDRPEDVAHVIEAVIKRHRPL